MKTGELREMNREDLEVRLAEVREELFNLRFQNATGRLDNYGRLGVLRREVARIETVMREGELGIDRSVAAEVAEAREKRPRRRLFRKAPVIEEAEPATEDEELDEEAAQDEAGAPDSETSDDDEQASDS